MRNCKQTLLTVLCAIFASTSFASGDDIKLMVSASPWQNINRIVVSSGGGTKLLIDDLTSDQLIATSISPNNERFETSIIGEWKEKGAQSVPLFRFSAFSLQDPLEIYFIRETENPKDNANSAYINHHCSGAQPDNMREAFTQISECAPLANYYKSNDLDSKSNYFKALNGWFVAGYYLYAGLGYKFSPFGLDDDLVNHMKEISDRVAAGRPATNFKPLRIDDIDAALKARRAEHVRMVSLIPTLKSQGHFGAALEIARAGLKNYDELTSDQSGNVVIFGIDRSTLESMVSDLESMSSGTEGPN